MNIWTNGGARSFEDRMTLDFDSNDLVPAVGSMLVFSARLIQTATSAAMLVLVVTTSQPRRFNAMPRSHEWVFDCLQLLLRVQLEPTIVKSPNTRQGHESNHLMRFSKKVTTIIIQIRLISLNSQC